MTLIKKHLVLILLLLGVKQFKMETTPFNIYYSENNKMHILAVRPCCNEDNVVDYAIWRDDKLAFTITKDKYSGIWVVALRNADDYIDNELVQLIGGEIEKITGT